MSKKNYVRLIILIIFTRVLDGITTFYVTPDLKYEMNFLVRYFDLGWIPFILMGVVLVILTIILLSFSFYNQEYLKVKSNSINRYLVVLLYDNTESIWNVLYKVPHKRSALVLFGFIFSISLVLYSCFLILNNTFMYLTDYSEFLYYVLGLINDYFTLIHVLVVVLIVVLTFYKVLKTNYNLQN